MKTLFLVPLIFLCILQSLQAQSDSLIIKKSYRIWVSPVRHTRFHFRQGLLYSVKDSSILVSDTKNKEDYYHARFKTAEVNANLINNIVLRRTGQQGIGVAIGAATGFIIGMILGVTQHTGGGNEGDKSMQDGGLVIIPLLFTGAGAGIGAAIASFKINIPIKGSQEKFDQNKERLISYSLLHNTTGSLPAPPVFTKLRDTVADIDNNVYHTIGVGNQVWMKENLRVKHYRNGEPVANISDSADWRQLSTGACCNYKNGPDTGKYGSLYNWYAVSDPRKLCPAGWHEPSSSEWTSMINSLGGEGKIEKTLKARQNPHMVVTSEDAVIHTFFTLLGGSRNHEGKFSGKGKSGYWWSVTEKDSVTTRGVSLNQDKEIKVADYYKKRGFSVRCVRDTEK
jgi:uncharacterized protein (TIGR02145 family)